MQFGRIRETQDRMGRLSMLEEELSRAWLAIISSDHATSSR